MRVCTQAQQQHLDEIYELARRFGNSVKTSFPSGDIDTNVAHDDLFPCLEAHFPEDGLWRKYELLRNLAQRYAELWQGLVDEANRKAQEDTGLEGPVGMTEGLASAFVPTALWFAVDQREKWTARTEESQSTEEEADSPVPSPDDLYRIREIQASVPYAVEFVPEHRDIAWCAAELVPKCRSAHWNLIKKLWAEAKIIELVSLRAEIRRAESTINRQLRLTLLKRTHIANVCDFCPVRTLRAELT